MDRKTILADLRSRKHILGFGAGCGMTARAAEKGGADFISIYTTAFCRIEGVPSFLAWLPYGDCNEDMRRLAPKIVPLVKKTPLVAGLGAHDPRIDIGRLVDEFVEMGFHGVSNEPFCSTYGKEFSRQLTKMGIGFNRELELIKTAASKDILTLGWADTVDEAVRLADAGADIIGLLAGGEKLEKETDADFLKRQLDKVSEMNLAAKQTNSQVLTLVHGGPVNNVEVTRQAVAATGVDGSATGSGGEKLPSEKAVEEITRAYREL